MYYCMTRSLNGVVSVKKVGVEQHIVTFLSMILKYFLYASNNDGIG